VYKPLKLIERGVPERMYPMEMVCSDPEDDDTRQLFDDIKETLSLSSINSDYRTLALWPNYLEVAWRDLKPITKRQEYRESSHRLREHSRDLARAVPVPSAFSSQELEKLGEDSAEIISTTDGFEELLPSLIINIALFQLDWSAPSEAAMSPFPAAPREEK
jgi:hypothetical protein